jgi:hypothetical protein
MVILIIIFDKFSIAFFIIFDKKSSGMSTILPQQCQDHLGLGTLE